MGVTVRTGELDAALSVLPFIPEFDQDDGPHGTWAASAKARLEGKDSLVFTASTEGSPLAGMLIAYDRYANGSLYCWLAAVVPPARRRGVLRALMTAMREQAVERGYASIRIGTLNRFRGMLAYLVSDGYAILSVTPAVDLRDSRISLSRELP